MDHKYFKAGEYAVAINHKVATSTLARSIIQRYHTEIEKGIQKAHYPKGKGPNDIRWQFICPKVNPDNCKEIYQLVRCPIERFKSACAEDRLTPEQALDVLESGNFKNLHFAHQSRFVEVTKFYKFETEFDKFAEDLNLIKPLPKILHPKPAPKPELTFAQILRVKLFYSEDIKLYEKLR